MDSILSVLAELIEKGYIAPLCAFLAGMVASLTPCNLASLPLVFACMSNGDSSIKRSRVALMIVLGTTITFTVLGVGASIIGSVVGQYFSVWYISLGVLMTLMTLQVWGVYEFVPSTYLINKNKRTGYIGGFICGLLSGVFSSPCCTPILVVLLSLVAEKGALLYGVLMLISYSIGHGVLILFVGVFTDKSKEMMKSDKYAIFANNINKVLGLVFFGIALYMFYLGV